MSPFRERQSRQVLVACFMLLEGNLGCVFYAASDRDERAVFQFNFKEKNEILEQVKMLEEEELRVFACQEAKIQKTPKRGLPKIMGVLVSILRQTNFSHDDVQPRSKVHGLEHIRLV